MIPATKTVILAPADRLGPKPPSPQEMIQLQAVEIRELQRRLHLQEIAAHTIGVFAACLVKIILEHTGGEHVEVPRSLYRFMDGSELQIANHQADAVGPIYGRVVEAGTPCEPL